MIGHQKTQESEERNMPKGKGTYGSQVGRPSKKQSNEYFGGGIVTNDARDRMQNMVPDAVDTNVSMPMYKKGGQVKKYKGGEVVDESLPDDLLTPEAYKISSDIAKELEAHKKGELKNKPYKRKYTVEEKSEPKYGKDAKSQQEKKIKITKRKDSERKTSYIVKEGIGYKAKSPDAAIEDKENPKFMGKEYETKKSKKGKGSKK